MRSRFDCPSSRLSLKRLLDQARAASHVALGLAVAAHLIFGGTVGGDQREQKTVRPLTVQFVKRQPRLSKPLELKKRPRPRQRQMRREVVRLSAAAAAPRHTEAFQATSLLHSLAAPRPVVSRAAAWQDGGSEPMAAAQVILTQKEAKELVDSSLEMMDIDALDTGQYHAMVIQDPSDKRSIRGYLHIVHAYPRSIVNSVPDGGSRMIAVVALRGLVEAMNKYTQIKTDLGARYTFDSKELMKIPFVLTSSGGYSFDHTVSEARNLGRYLFGGGFYIADCRAPSMGPDRPSSRSFRRFIAAGLESEGAMLGRDWNWEKIPNHHPIYHCYFEFPEGPPPGVDNLVFYKAPTLDYLEGITWSGRLLTILSLKAYTAIWEADARSAWGNSRDNARQRQFGVNLVIFALTQEGSVTRRVMDSVQ